MFRTSSRALRRLGIMCAGALAAVSLAAAPAAGMPVPDWDDGAEDTAPAVFSDDLSGAWRHIAVGDDTLRARPRLTPSVVFEQRCVRRGLCLIRVLIDDGVRQWSCRPAVRTRGGHDDAAEAREGRLERAGTQWSGRDWFGEDDDEVARPALTRLRLACVRI